MTEEKESVSQVKVLAPNERESFQGITIEEPEKTENASSNQYEYYRETPTSRIYVKSVGFHGWLPKLILGAVILGFLAFMVFIFLPVAVMAVIGGIAIWLLRNWKKL